MSANDILPPIDIGCDGDKACTAVVGQEGWQNLHPTHQKVLAFYPEGKRNARYMAALWQSTWDLWNNKIAPEWMEKAAELYGQEWPAPLRRIKAELAEWRSRMNAYQVSLQANPDASEAAVHASVTDGLLLNHPGSWHPVPDFLFPLYIENQINVLEAAHKANRKYLIEQITVQTRLVRDAVVAIPKAVGTALLGDLLLPLAVSVAGGVAVYLITKRKRK